jgi:hypothetical protein
MSSSAPRRRNSPFQLLVHLMMAPRSSGTFSWQIAPDQMASLAEDLRWIVLRRIFPDLNGATPYRALLQKHAIRVESLDVAFFREVLDVIREEYASSFSLSAVRALSDLECLKQHFLPVILTWAATERSTSVARERTPSIEDLVLHEDMNGNLYQRFPDEFSWELRRSAPDICPNAPRELPEDMKKFARRIASDLTCRLKELLDSGKYEKYVLLMSRLEDDACTWEMTFDYLKTFGVKRYSSWKSLSVVANRALKEFVGGLPPDLRVVLHQDDPLISQEEKHARLREAVSAALEINPLPSPREILAEMVA